MSEYRIALIHATTAAINPAVVGLAEEFPEARPWNILDDRLLSDATQAGRLNDQLVSRMRSLIRHAAEGGADAVLLTCSLYGPVAQAEKEHVPTLPPDEAAFDAAASGGYRRIAVVASFEAATADSVKRFAGHAAAQGFDVETVGVCVPDTFDPAAAGFRLVSTADFSGSSHKTLTKEVYTK